jgi:hypothetical protein
VGGGQIGCDYQFVPGWVLGAEGRGGWTNLKASNAGAVRFSTGAVVPSQFGVSNDFLASATARLGYSFVDRWLFYVKGGAAWTDEKVDDAFTNLRGIAVDPSTSTTRTGWTAGSGVEWAFARNWSAMLEYDYYDFGSKGLTLIEDNAIVNENRNRAQFQRYDPRSHRRRELSFLSRPANTSRSAAKGAIVATVSLLVYLAAPVSCSPRQVRLDHRRWRARVLPSRPGHSGSSCQ